MGISFIEYKTMIVFDNEKEETSPIAINKSCTHSETDLIWFSPALVF